MKITDTRSLPNGRLRLPAFGLGGAALGGLFTPVGGDEAGATLAAAWAAGVRYFDTAPYYGHTRSERRLGVFLSEQPREGFVLSTKVGRLMVPDAGARASAEGWAGPLPFRPHFDYSHDAVMRSFEDSLQRLGLSHIDILLVHDIGRMTHGDRHGRHWHQLTVGGGFRALGTLRRDGRVSAIGLGVNEPAVLHAAMQECQLDCTLLAGRYTLLEQAGLQPLLQACRRHGNALVIGGPFNSGVLAGEAHYNYAEAPAGVLERVRALEAACREHQVPLPAAALQFPLAHPAVLSVVAGVRHPVQLRQNIEWFEQPIPPELWVTLRERGLLDEDAPCPGQRI